MENKTLKLQEKVSLYPANPLILTLLVYILCSVKYRAVCVIIENQAFLTLGKTTNNNVIITYVIFAITNL